MNSTTTVARRPSAGPAPPSARPEPGGHAGDRDWRVIGRFADAARRESPRRLLWLPVALGGGIGVYFSLPAEPSALLGPALLTGAIGGALLVRRNALMLWVSLLLVAAALGLSAAQLRTRTVGTVMLDREVWATVEGRVTAIERRPAGWRLTLADVALAEPRRDIAVPTGVRVAIGGRTRDAQLQMLRIGDRVRVRSRLRPPSPPVSPAAYDFQRDAYFRGIGAVGFAVGDIALVHRSGAPVTAGVVEGIGPAIDRIRLGVAVRIRAALPDPAGAVAAAMLVGDRAGIDEPTADTFRETGLAHLLAISGLHMGLVAGTVYAAMRLALSAFPAIALRRPVKKWAAGAALAVAAAYLLLAGAPVPTQRAFLMTGLVLAAVLLDREAISLHLVAWAAAAVLLISPEALIGPSFQLSFAAVTALIGLWEAVARRHRRRPGKPPGWLGRTVRYVAGVAATSLVASLVTAPVAAHHFQQVPVLGAVANLVAVPVTAFLTMPAGVVALLAMPLGLEAWPLRTMGWGIDLTLRVAGIASDAPLTAVGVAALGTAPLVLLALGGLWLTLWRTVLRWLGAVFVVAGLLATAWERSPDAFISADGELAAVRIPGVGWAISREGGRSFVRDAWRRRWGGASATGFLTAEALAGGGADGFGCDGLGCVLRVRGRLLAMPATPEAAIEDCERADLVVTGVRLRRPCPGNVRTIDLDVLRREGAFAVWLTDDGIRTRSVAEVRGHRPWTGTIDRRKSPVRE